MVCIGNRKSPFLFQSFQLIKILTWNWYVKRASLMLKITMFELIYFSTVLQVLKQVGVQNLFDKKGNFSDLYECSPKHSLDKCLLDTEIIHNAKIEVNELGSKASAMTSVIATQFSRPFDFNCNRPFVFIVHDKKFKEILFAGVFRGPEI